MKIESEVKVQTFFQNSKKKKIIKKRAIINNLIEAVVPEFSKVLWS